ncbi:MAG TPA: type II toxin-antitoxin system VapB family antitoxin [Geminicoccaceae bacterium]|nr:type II toxin-antitoxin system VapB family antitoxin [Geminicoccaceae bacterium]
MALYIRSEEVDRLAHELAAATGETLTRAVGKAIEERLARVRPAGASAEQQRRERAREIILEAQALSRAYGTEPPSKAEIEEMLGMDW